MTDYKYRKIRGIVKKARVPSGVKELMFCALRSYKKGIVVPKNKVYMKKNKACLVGAAVYSKTGMEYDYDWNKRAAEEFGIEEIHVQDIVYGFDSDEHTNPGTKTVSDRIERLAKTVGVALGVTPEYVTDED